MQGCSEASLTLKAFLAVLVHSEYKSVETSNEAQSQNSVSLSLSRSVASAAFCLLAAVLISQNRTYRKSLPGPGSHCALHDQPPGDRQVDTKA